MCDGTDGRNLCGIIASAAFLANWNRMDKAPGSGSKPTATIFIGKWTVMILSALQRRPYRHGELRRRLGSVSQRVLTRTLRNLESSGLIARRVTTSKSIAVEYSLTSLGKAFMKPLTSICGWAKRHRKGLSATIRLLEMGRDGS